MDALREREHALGARRSGSGGRASAAVVLARLGELWVGSGRRLVEDPRKLPERHVKIARRCRYVVVKLVAERNLHVVFQNCTSLGGKDRKYTWTGDDPLTPCLPFELAPVPF